MSLSCYHTLASLAHDVDTFRFYAHLTRFGYRVDICPHAHLTEEPMARRYGLPKLGILLGASRRERGWSLRRYDLLFAIRLIHCTAVNVNECCAKYVCL